MNGYFPAENSRSFKTQLSTQKHGWQQAKEIFKSNKITNTKYNQCVNSI